MSQALDDKEVISLQKWWIRELSKITQKLLNDETKRQEKIKKKNEELMGEYQTEQDIMDAYGYGMISEKKKDRLMDLLEERTDAEPGRLYNAKIKMLTDLYLTAKTIVMEKERVIE